MYAHTYIHTDTDLTSSDEPCTSGGVHSSNLDDKSCNPAAKCQALSTSEYGEVASFVGSRFLSADCKYNLLVNHFKPFQRVLAGVRFSTDGSYSFLGLRTVSRRMVAFVFPVFSLPLLGTMDQILVYL